MKACPACNSRFSDEVEYCARDGTPVVVDQQAAPDEMIGQVIAERYKLVRKLGEGGMGEVYVAEHVHIEKRVALKLLRSEILSNQEAVTRFRQEARSASSIGHKNIIEIDDFGTLPDGRVYLTMEYLQGAPLSDLAKEPLPLPRALDIIIQTAHGLGAAHAKGIVHRDMKPENIYVTQQDGRDVPKILDFGIAKVSGTDGNQHLTRTGTIFGTPFYMSPEQALGQALDHRSDIYAVGVIMYEVFTGAVPFKAESFMGILTQHITAPVPPPAQQAAAHGRQLPLELEQVILKALQKDPAQRYQSMNELVAALTEVYRRYIGPGSTQPYQAQPASPSAFVPIQTGHIPIPTPMPTPMPLPGAMGAQMMGGVPMPVPQQISGGVPLPSGAWAPAQAPPKQGSAWIIVLVLVLLAGGGGAGWYFLLGPGKGDSEAETVAGGETDGADAAPPAVVPDAAPVVVVKPPVVPDAGAKLVAVQVLVNSQPADAAIFAGETQLGETPQNVTVYVGQPLTLRLVLPGYEEATVVVDGTDKKVTQKLEKRSVARPDDKKPDDGPKPDDKKPDDGPKPDDKKPDPQKDPPKGDKGLVDEDDSDELE